MTTEEIIQRLLDEKHITVAEATQMIRDLVRNEIFAPLFPDKSSKRIPNNTTVVMYGVNLDNWDNISLDNITHEASSDNKTEK